MHSILRPTGSATCVAAVGLAFTVMVPGLRTSLAGDAQPATSPQRSTGEAQGAEDATQQLVAATRLVVQRVTGEATANAALPPRRAPQSPAPLRRGGDALMQHYVRAAADEARMLAPELAPRAFLLGLAIACDDSGVLARIPLAGEFARKAESGADRKERMRVLLRPTMRERHDLAQHFLASAYLATAVGRFAAETTGVAKELSDADGGSGFSFADLAADYAGIKFAQHVLDRRISLPHLAETFTVVDFLPEMADLPEALPLAAFRERYGSPTDPRYRRLLNTIQERLEHLPGFAASLTGR